MSSDTRDQESEEPMSDNLFDQFSEVEVFRNLDILRDFYTPDEVHHRDKELKKLVIRLRPALKDDQAGHALLEGPNGSGKTVVSKYVGQNFITNEKIEDASLAHINCGSVTTEHQLVAQIVNNLQPAEKDDVGRGYSTDDLLQMACDEISKLGQTVLLILDEVGGVNQMNNLLYHLTRTRQDGTYIDETNVSVIFTGNDLTFVENLSGAVRSTFVDLDKINFEPYNATELQDILTHRAEQAFLDQKITEGAVKLAGALAAQQGGDARYGLRMLLKAGEYALEQSDAPVTEEHIKVGKERLDRERVGELLSQFKPYAQLALVAIISLQKQGTESPIGTDIITEYQRIGFPVNIEQGRQSVYGYLRDLEDRNLISTQDGPRGSKQHDLLYPEKAVLDKLDDTLFNDLQEVGFINQHKDSLWFDPDPEQ